jgi:glucose/arabinose dehydrogenase
VAVPAAAQDARVSTYTTGLEQPWELAFLPDGRALVTERAGRVRLLATDGSIAGTALTISVGGGEGGTLGLVLDPAFAENGLVYLYRTLPDQSANQVLRYRFDGDRLVDQALVVGGIPAGNIHNGGRLAIAPDGFLYITTGDAGASDSAQVPFERGNAATYAGKILRVPPSGYRDGGGGLEGVSRGHRNPQGLDFQPGSNQLYADEHGPTGNDEVNRIVQGGNYGWPDAVGPNHPQPFISPLATYSTIAPSGAIFVRRPGSQWTGDYLIGALRGQRIQRLRLDGDRVTINEALFQDRFGRVRDVTEGPDGALYAITGNGDDVVVRIVPPPAEQPPPQETPPPGPPLTEPQRLTEVDAFGGWAAWSAFEQGAGYRLVLRNPDGAIGAAPVAPRAVPFDVDLGPSEDGGVVAAYSRCAQEPDAYGAGGILLRTTGRRCDIFRLDPATGRETRLEGASTESSSEFLPSIWRDSVAFARVFESREGRRGDLPYLYVRPLDGGRSERQPGGSRGDGGLPGPTGIDLYGRRMSFTWEWRDGERLRSELRLDTVGGDHALIERLGSEEAPANLVTPGADRGRIYVGTRRLRGSANTSGALRLRISTDQLTPFTFPAGPALAALSVDDGAALLATAGDPRQAPRCGPGGCAIRPLDDAFGD